MTHYLKFSTQEEMLQQLAAAGYEPDESGQAGAVVLCGNRGRAWGNIGVEVIDVEGWHANAELDELPAVLLPYEVPAPATPFMVTV